MVMDEAGRNGRNWHLAQQLTYHVTLYIFQQLAQLVIMQKNNKSHRYELGSYKYQKFSPVSNYNNLQFVNK